MGSKSQQDKIDELAALIDDMKTTVDELAAEDPLPDADATNLDASFRRPWTVRATQRTIWWRMSGDEDKQMLARQEVGVGHEPQCGFSHSPGRSDVRDHRPLEIPIRRWATRPALEPDLRPENPTGGPSTVLSVSNGGTGLRFNFPGAATFRPIGWVEWLILRLATSSSSHSMKRWTATHPDGAVSSRVGSLAVKKCHDSTSS